MHCPLFLLGSQYCFVIAKPLIGTNVRNANENEFPFVVSVIQINQSASTRIYARNHVCTGTLISRQDVLTAEHCIIFESMDELEIITGSTRLRHCVRYPIFWWITYDQWANIQNVEILLPINDVACIRVYIHLFMSYLYLLMRYKN
jgi:hypothetical protein